MLRENEKKGEKQGKTGRGGGRGKRGKRGKSDRPGALFNTDKKKKKFHNKMQINQIQKYR